ncbi:alpha-galactosidase [Seonamhaeicola marinus]|uniref:Alpha-galactosidase n=1 Tax=Seonamhaeicola marinus TaxID=1912246 RepID=A0A5D0J182_9FLAO|nr:alpha-galactosidase [Seonamhaeicola marinus]TYA89231.1 hypothetical protein FUA24_03610 [Seonamhaeicola marinus]
MTTKRRDFIKKTGLGIASIGFLNTLNADTKSADPEFVFNDINGGSDLEMKSFRVTAPLFCPYHSIPGGHPGGGGSHYYRKEAFTHNPFTIRASGMSGSPVIVDANGKFFGFMSTFGYENSTFNFNGTDTLTIQIPNGQDVFVDESGNGDTAWKIYNTKIMGRLGIEPLKDYPKFWSDVEYCTWVEQKYQRTHQISHFNLLTHEFVKKYIDAIIDLGYPKGKLTLDHGWGQFPSGHVDSGFGSWVPDPKKFPDFKNTMEMIQEKGFTPGLWIGFPKIHKDSLIAKKSPNLLGQWEARGEKIASKGVRYLNPAADIYNYASEVIGRFNDMGVKKFKIDMSYNTKSDMLHIHKELYRAAKNINPELEMEFHVSDIFFAKYADVIRTNDVWLRDNVDWEGRVKTHYKVASQSCPGRGINLDHIGGNDTKVITEQKFLKHLNMYKNKIGYPLVSVLPNHFGEKCTRATGDYLWQYANGPRKLVSDFYIKED